MVVFLKKKLDFNAKLYYGFNFINFRQFTMFRRMPILMTKRLVRNYTGTIMMV